MSLLSSRAATHAQCTLWAFLQCSHACKHTKSCISCCNCCLQLVWWRETSEKHAKHVNMRLLMNASYQNTSTQVMQCSEHMQSHLELHCLLPHLCCSFSHSASMCCIAKHVCNEPVCMKSYCAVFTCAPVFQVTLYYPEMFVMPWLWAANMWNACKWALRVHFKQFHALKHMKWCAAVLTPNIIAFAQPISWVSAPKTSL